MAFKTPIIHWSKQSFKKIGSISSTKRTVEEFLSYFESIVRPLGVTEKDFTKVFKFFISDSATQELYHPVVFCGNTDSNGQSIYIDWSLTVDWIQHRWRTPNEKYLILLIY